MPAATACARANIALVKYWGKRDAALNLPEAGSLSLTLEALRTTTTVELLETGASDRLVLDGVEQPGKALARVTKHLDLIRKMAGPERGTRAALVRSENAFPTAAGLASSASAFAALSVAASHAYGVELSPRELSVLARRGSGSAARSIFGGFVRMEAGTAADGSDAAAHPVEGCAIELAACAAVADAGPKEVGSTEGMEHTRGTSPFHAAWIAQVARDLTSAEAALRAGDFERLTEVVEGSCLAMHADAMAARPGVIYLRAPTLAAIDRVRALRRDGTPVMFTIDAGPHLVAFTPPAHLGRVAEALGEIPGVSRVIQSLAGGAARLLAGGSGSGEG